MGNLHPMLGRARLIMRTVSIKSSITTIFTLGLLSLSLIGIAIPTGGSAGPDPKSNTSGISGQVLIRPIRPHATIGAENVTPFQASVDVLNQSGQLVTSFQSDTNGNFRITLPPGRYTLKPNSPGPYPRASQQAIVVEPNKYIEISIMYDSGIR
jgi:hypothetical protein